MTVRVTSLKGAAAGEYYVSEVGSYYLAAEEPRGRWFGDGAARLGLAGEIDDGQFVSLLAGVDPSSGVPLGRPFGERSVRGYDVTFSAPKSVSVLAAVADPATRGGGPRRARRRGGRRARLRGAPRADPVPGARGRWCRSTRRGSR